MMAPSAPRFTPEERKQLKRILFLNWPGLFRAFTNMPVKPDILDDLIYDAQKRRLRIKTQDLVDALFVYCRSREYLINMIHTPSLYNLFGMACKSIVNSEREEARRKLKMLHHMTDAEIDAAEPIMDNWRARSARVKTPPAQQEAPAIKEPEKGEWARIAEELGFDV